MHAHAAHALAVAHFSPLIAHPPPLPLRTHAHRLPSRSAPRRVGSSEAAWEGRVVPLTRCCVPRVQVVNYPSPDVEFTRIVEYKHVPNQPENVKRGEVKGSLIAKEISSAVGDPYYPVPNPKNNELYEKYRALAEKEEGVAFVGRCVVLRAVLNRGGVAARPPGPPTIRARHSPHRLARLVDRSYASTAPVFANPEVAPRLFFLRFADWRPTSTSTWTRPSSTRSRCSTISRRPAS